MFIKCKKGFIRNPFLHLKEINKNGFKAYFLADNDKEFFRKTNASGVSFFK